MGHFLRLKGVVRIKTRTPALKKAPNTSSSDWKESGTGWFSWTLCAPNRPGRLPKSSLSGSGRLLIITGFDSTRASTTQASLG